MSLVCTRDVPGDNADHAGSSEARPAGATSPMPGAPPAPTSRVGVRLTSITVVSRAVTTPATSPAAAVGLLAGYPATYTKAYVNDGYGVVRVFAPARPAVRVATGAAAVWGAALLSAWLATHAGAAQAADRYVDAAHPAATNAGLGPEATPYRSLAYGVSQLQPGDRLFVKEGVYRESARLPLRTWSNASQTTIEGIGKVIIKASDIVTNWTSLGNGRYVTPLAKETAQVMLNGTALKQIGGRLFNAEARSDQWPGRVAGNQDTMPLDSFYYDRATAQLYVRTSLTTLAGQTVEVSTRMFSLFGEGLANLTVKNLTFQYGNTSPFNRSGQITLIGNRITVARVTVINADAVGLEVVGNDNQILDSVANYNGQVGIKARGSRVVVSRNTANFNNTRGFNKWWEAGGMKFTGNGGLQDSRVSFNTVNGNKADGIWFDWANRNNRVENNVTADNSGFGIQYEASFKGIITNNYVVNNGQRGIYLPHSSDSVVAFNLVAGNKLQGIVNVDEGVRDPKGLIDLKPVGNKIFGNLVAFNAGALVLPADLSTHKSDGNAYAGAPTVMTFRQGWSGMSLTLSGWQSATGNDLNSRFQTLTFTGSTASAYINWGKAYRTTVPQVVVPADWLALVPGLQRDLYPGAQPQ